MSKQNKSTQVGNRIILNGTALLLLAYMLAKIVQAYIVSGTDAPGIKVLLLGIVVLAWGRHCLRRAVSCSAAERILPQAGGFFGEGAVIRFSRFCDNIPLKLQ